VSATPDLIADFHALEAMVEEQPEGVRAEIAHGTYLMSPRPKLAHGAAQVKLGKLLDQQFGTRGEGRISPDWLLVVEPEVRSEIAFSRVIPDLAGWKRSAGGWPDANENPVTLVPDWVAEVLSPSTESFDRGPKKDACGLMGVGWLWLVDPERRTVEAFVNVKGRMTTGARSKPGEPFTAPPFESLALRLEDLFL
jgi:Uma2 family endonuclease